MRRTKITAVIALVLAMLCVIGPMQAVLAASGSNTPATQSGDITGTVAEAIEILGDIKWNAYREMYADAEKYTGADITVDPGTASFDAQGDDASSISYNYDPKAVYDGVSCIVLPEIGEVTFKVNVPKAGLYSVSWDYYDLPCKATNIERTFRINGKVPFNEVRNLIMSKNWIDNYRYDENGAIVYDKDGNGNDRRPSKSQTPCWTSYTV